MMLIILLAVVCWDLAVVSSMPFYLPDHPYISPPIDENFGILRGRSPCPGLNTLANHGYIHRNGSQVTFRSVVEASEEVFGIHSSITVEAIAGVLARKPSIARMMSMEESNQEGRLELLEFNLFDLYDDERKIEVHGKPFREDRYFDHFAQFNESIFNPFVAEKARDGTISLQDLVKQKVDRIVHSRETNPEATFDELLPSDYARSMASEVLGFMNFGDDPDLLSVSVDFLLLFGQENRIPDEYLPRQARNLSLVSTSDPWTAEVLANVTAALEAAITTPLDKSNQTGISSTGFLFLVISLSSAILVSIMILLHMLGARSLVMKCFTTIGAESSTSDVDCDTDVEGKSKCHDSDTDVVTSTDEQFILSWHDISAELNAKTRGDDTSNNLIISQMNGSAKSGQLTGILGPSGSGKSTLLAILGGRLQKNKSITVQGQMKLNGISIPKEYSMVKSHVHVESDDSHFVENITAREAIRFSARLRLPSTVSESKINDLVDDILTDLDLNRVKDRPISLSSGLSGGEKRRVSLGIALVTRPRVLLLDEVTSGLDSDSAHMVVRVCRDIARRRQAAILMIIHQPSLRTFSLMDSVVFLKSGRCLYQGLSSEVGQTFAERGFDVPDNYNAPDWALEVTQSNSIERLEECGFFTTDETNGTNNAHGSLSGDISLINGMISATQGSDRVSIGTEIWELWRRQVVPIQRDPSLFLIRGTMILSISLVIGLCFLGVGREYLDTIESFTSHVGVVFMLGFFCSITMLIGVTDGIVSRKRFTREFATGHYRLVSHAIVQTVFNFLVTLAYSTLYLVSIFWTIGLNGRFWYWYCLILLYSIVSVFLADVVVAVPKVPEVAHDAAPILITPQLLFSGFLVLQESLPKWIRWMTWTQPLTYVFRLLLNEEFRQCENIPSEDSLLLDCAKAVDTGIRAAHQEGYRAMYDEDSELTLMQGGRYIGRDAILEYFAFLSPAHTPFSLVWDSCQLKGSQFLSVNRVTEGSCDVTLSGVYQARVNENFKTQSSNSNPLVNLVLGRQLVIEYPPDLSSMRVKNESIFLPPAFFDYVYNNSDELAMAVSNCQVLSTVCPQQYAQNSFLDELDCIETMLSLPLTTMSEAGINTVDGNSTGCRNLHASMAVVSPEVHCPHLSFVPMEDINGQTKCSISSNYAFEDHFTLNDFALFRRTAQSNGLDADTYFDANPPNDGSCMVEQVVETETIQSARVLPDNYFCYSYLENQRALDEDGLILTYWLGLFGFVVAIRLVGLFLLRHKSSSS